MVSGQCLCGAVHFEVRAPLKWCAHCHCTQCQRAHGAAFVTWMGAVADSVTINNDTALTWYASSAEALRGFCRDCGSSLFFKSSRWPGELHIVRANLNEDIELQPQCHVFYDTHVNWITLADDLPRKVV